MMQTAIEAAGWIGGGLILIGYWLVSSGRVQGKSRTFQLLNLFGSLGFVANAAWYGAIPPMTLNIIWCIISLYTLATLRKQRPAE